MHTTFRKKFHHCLVVICLQQKQAVFSSCSPTIVPLHHSLTYYLTYQPPLPTPTSQSHQNTEKIKSKLMSLPVSQSSEYSVLWTQEGYESVILGWHCEPGITLGPCSNGSMDHWSPLQETLWFPSLLHPCYHYLTSNEENNQPAPASRGILIATDPGHESKLTQNTT